MATPRMFNKASNSSKDKILEIISKEHGFIAMHSDSNTGDISATFDGTNRGLICVLKQSGASVKEEKATNPNDAYADMRAERNYITIEKSMREKILTDLIQHAEARDWARRLRAELDVVIKPLLPR